MKRTEIIKILALVAVLYPRDSAFKNADDAMINAWEAMLKDISFRDAQQALQYHASISPFPPSISDIRGCVAKSNNSQLGPDEAWGYVEAAIRKYGYYRAKEARASMPAEVWEMVQRIGWGDICMSECPGVERGQFMKMWDTKSKRDREYAVLPENIRKLIGSTSISLLQDGGSHGQS